MGCCLLPTASAASDSPDRNELDRFRSALGAQASALVKRGSLNGLDDVIWFIDKVYWGAAIRIEHVATWTGRLDQLKEFYVTYFGAEASSKYVNPDKNFKSYFLSFSTGARLELMQSPGVADQPVSLEVHPVGYAHLAFSVGSKEQVDSLTTQLRTDGYQVVSTPRFTGDGYYESVVLDPDGNRIEITI